MAVNTLSKNSISIIVSLLLVIILSESKLFFFFTESYLGRSILILILLFASYINKILGVVCVFIIIIMFNSNKFLNFEGFANSPDTTSMPGAGGGGVRQPTNTSSMPGAGGSGTNQPTSISTTTSMPGAGGSGINQPTPAQSKINVVKGKEGFDLQSTENTIRRGKQSNSIQVSPYLKSSVEVAPYEGLIQASSFNEGFSLY